MALDLGLNYLTVLANLIRAEIDPKLLPDEPLDNLLRMYAVLALALGSEVRIEDVHNVWVSWMLETDPDHPALVPFDDLDRETAQQDEPFVRAIRSVASKHNLADWKIHVDDT